MMSLESPTATVRWPVLKVRPQAAAGVVLLGADFVRLATHFSRSTFLCPEVEECDACNLLPVRCYWYLPAMSTATHRPCLLELTAAAASDLEQRARFVGDKMRPGLQVQLARTAPKRPMRLEVLGETTVAREPALWEWVSPLMAIFKMPAMHPGETLELYGERIKARVLERANLSAVAARTAAGTRH